MRRQLLGRRALVGLLGGVLTLTGCGIRTTQVPVDAGPAPSRVPCETTGANFAQSRPETMPVRVYLACASQLKSVDRTADLPMVAGDEGRVRVAQALLAQLRVEPSDAEREAGFDTAVRGPMMISGPRQGDPEGTLRLSRQPEDLPTTALAQIVCTFAESRAAAPGGAVVLGGPGEYPPRGYTCSEAIKDRPRGPVPTYTALPSPAASPSAP